MEKEVSAIIKQIKAKKYAPVYFLTGEEPYYIDFISDFIEDNVLNEGEKGFNQMVLYGKDVECNAIVQNARRFPMMSDYQVIIVKEAQEILDFNKEEGQKVLMQYFEKPSPTTILVFNYKYKKLDARKAITKKIATAGVYFTSNKLYDNQLVPWIENHVKSLNLKINARAKMLLAESIGLDLNRMANEIQKVTINLKDGEEITEEQIQKYIGISKDYNVFELQKWLSYKNSSKVFKIINYFGENPKSHPIIPILSNLFSFFSKLMLAHEYGVKSESDVASKLKINPFFSKDYIVAIKNYKISKKE